LIKEASNALRVFVNLLSQKPLATLAALIILFMAYISYRSYDAIQDSIVTPEEEARRFQDQLSSASLVNDAIENLALETRANNVVIRQFHNGRHDLTGIPFTEATTTFFTKSYDTPAEERLSELNTSLRMMWREIDKPECIIIKSGVDHSTRKYFREYQLNRAVICPLTNLLNYPIGTITVGFSASNAQFSDRFVLQKTHLVARRVTGYLNESF
jgi:hypothetical protein